MCVAIIVDCFDIRTERSSNLRAHAQSFSHYKGTHNEMLDRNYTPKPDFIYFKGIGEGGGASDKHITENCGLLNKLLLIGD